MKKIILLVLGMLTLGLNAQTIEFTIPEHANKEFLVEIYNGIKIDTIAVGRVSMVGGGKFTVPEKYKNVSAMSALSFGENTKPIDLILHGVPFSFELSREGKFTFKNSSENDLFYNRQSEVMSEANKGTYVQAYVKTLNTMVMLSKVIGSQGRASMYEQTTAKIAVLNDVDMDKLYYSRFWFFAIDGLLRLASGEEGFAKDMIRLIDKTATQPVFVALVEDAIMIMNQYGMDDAFDIVILHVQKLNRIEYPQGSIYDAFEMMKVMRGNPAPALKGLEVGIKEADRSYTLLVFHQPGCDNCQLQLDELNKEFSLFEKYDVRIVSISGALDKKAFETEKNTFRWKDTLCDYKGFGGVNFMNYGINGTPTFFLIDRNNVIIKRFALVSDIQKYLIGTLE